MRIQTECISFENRWMITSSYDFQAHQQHSQRRCFSQTALQWFNVLPGASRCTCRRLHQSSKLWDLTTLLFWSDNCQTLPVTKIHFADESEGGMYDTRRQACNSPSEGMRICQCHQSRPEHPGVSDRNWSCCWCLMVMVFTLAALIRQCKRFWKL